MSADRPLVIVGWCALALAIVVMIAHIALPTARAVAVPGILSLSTGTGASLLSHIAAGTDVTIVYEVTVTNATGSIITLDIAPAGSLPSLFSERWPRGTYQRSISLVPLSPGIWRVTLMVDGRHIATDSFTIMPT